MPYIWRCQISYNGSGTFLINSAGQPVVPGTTITTTAFNALTADLASGLTTAMTKDGQTVPTANIPMGGFKLTGLGAGTSATDAAQFGQLQNAPVATLITVSGADTITGTLVQTLTAYATGQQFSFVAAGTNTTAVTLNIDGLGAKAVTRTGAVALAAGALVSGQMAIVEYDGTRFQLINANAFTNLTVSGALTVGTTLAVTGVATLTAQPILSSLTASLPVFSDASKGLVSNAMTGTGSVMMSASPTTTGTLTAAAINASGLVAMAGAATVGTTLGVAGVGTFGVASTTAASIKMLNTAAGTSSILFRNASDAGSNASINMSNATGVLTIDATYGLSVTGTLGVTGVSTLTGGATIGTGSNVLGLKVGWLTATNTKTSSTALTTLSDLTIAIGAGETWLIEYTLVATAGLEATGLSLQVDTPASAVQDIFYEYIGERYDLVGGLYTTPKGVYFETASGTLVSWTAADIVYGGKAAINIFVRVTASGAGNVTLGYAQETSSGTALNILRGSRVKAQRTA